MNFGNKLYELRKERNVTQEALAAELGVTAAAVSKWEKGYTLPDLLMLCALADYFEVTTDELLDRVANWKYAVVAAETMELGEKIAALIKSSGFITIGIFDNFPEALTAALADKKVSQIVAGFYESLDSSETDQVPDDLHLCQIISRDDEQVLKGVEMFLKHFM